MGCQRHCLGHLAVCIVACHQLLPVADTQFCRGEGAYGCVVDGKVEKVEHQHGRFRSAYLPKSSSENERSSIVIRTNGGTRILVRQIAGAIARRIVTYALPGSKADISAHLGFIKFGSRVDIYLPVDAEIFVKIGDKTIGGVTPIARLKE